MLVVCGVKVPIDGRWSMVDGRWNVSIVVHEFRGCVNIRNIAKLVTGIITDAGHVAASLGVKWPIRSILWD